MSPTWRNWICMLVPWRSEELDADIQSVDLDYLNGKFSFTHLTIADEKSNLLWIPLLWSLLQQQTKTRCFLVSIFKCWNRRKYKLTAIADAITRSTLYNYSFRKTSCHRRAAAAIQNCNFRQPNFSKIYSWTKEPWTYFLLRSLRHGQWFYCIKCGYP
jgi:hypothetical protein